MAANERPNECSGVTGDGSLVCLAIETSNPSLLAPAASGVAVGRIVPGMLQRTVVLGQSPLDVLDKRRDDLALCVQRALASAGLALVHVRCIAVSVGPGGFTSIRSAIATGAMLAETLGVMGGCEVSCRGVPSVLSAWFGLRDLYGAGPVGVALAAKADTVFAARFGAHDFGAAGDAGVYGEATGAAIVAGADADAWMAGIAGGVLTADEHLPELFAAAAARAGVRVVSPMLDGASCLAAAAVCPAIGAEAVAAIYGREPEAVTIWKRRAEKVK